MWEEDKSFHICLSTCVSIFHLDLDCKLLWSRKDLCAEGGVLH